MGGYERSKGGLGGSSLITVRNLAFARFWYNNNYTYIIIKNDWSLNMALLQ